MYAELGNLISQTHGVGLPVVVWAYTRGSGVPKGMETTADVCAYAVHIAAQLGADIIKCKPPATKGISLKANEKAYAGAGEWPFIQRVQHIIRSAFDGRVITIFFGGEKKDNEDDVLKKIRELAEGGGFGSTMGRNLFRREWAHTLDLANKIQEVYLAFANG